MSGCELMKCTDYRGGLCHYDSQTCKYNEDQRIKDLESERDKYKQKCLDYIDWCDARDAKIADLEAKLAEAVNLLKEGKRLFTPHTTNSDVDCFLKREEGLKPCMYCNTKDQILSDSVTDGVFDVVECACGFVCSAMHWNELADLKSQIAFKDKVIEVLAIDCAVFDKFSGDFKLWTASECREYAEAKAKEV